MIFKRIAFMKMTIALACMLLLSFYVTSAKADTIGITPDGQTSDIPEVTPSEEIEAEKTNVVSEKVDGQGQDSSYNFILGVSYLDNQFQNATGIRDLEGPSIEFEFERNINNLLSTSTKPFFEFSEADSSRTDGRSKDEMFAIGINQSLNLDIRSDNNWLIQSFLQAGLGYATLKRDIRSGQSGNRQMDIEDYMSELGVGFRSFYKSYGAQVKFARRYFKPSSSDVTVVQNGSSRGYDESLDGSLQDYSTDYFSFGVFYRF